nr:MAG TPA: hypothetical protein [Caudoviricetes sp.]
MQKPLRFSHLWRLPPTPSRGAVLFIFSHRSPQHAARAMQPTIRAERSHLSCGTGPRAPLNDVAQRGHMRRAEAEAKAMAIGNIVDVWRLDTVSPLQKRRADAFGNGHSARLKVRRCIVAWLEERFSASVCPRGG